MSEFEPKIVAFFCNWCTYLAADLAGASLGTISEVGSPVSRIRKKTIIKTPSKSRNDWTTRVTRYRCTGSSFQLSGPKGFKNL